MKKEVIAFRKRVPFYKNLVKSFYSKDWNVHPNAKVVNNNTLELYSTASQQQTKIRIPVKRNTFHTFQCSPNTKTGFRIYVHSADTASPWSGGYGVISESLNKIIFNTGENDFVYLYLTSGVDTVGTYVFKDLILAVGSFDTLEYFADGENILKERLKDNGHVSEIRVRFYPGVERTLRVAPYVLHKASRREDLFTYPTGSEGFIAGDDDTFVFPVQIDFEYDDELIVEYENVGNYIYTLSCDIVVVYHNEEVLS